MAVAALLVVLWDGFETMVLPRRVTRKLRLTRVFYRARMANMVAGSAAAWLRASGAKRI